MPEDREETREGFLRSILGRLPGAGKPGRRALRIPFYRNGYGYQVEEFIASLKKGEIENPTMPLSDTLRAMRVMDEARAQWN
jgi:hypothetical protein